MFFAILACAISGAVALLTLLTSLSTHHGANVRMIGTLLRIVYTLSSFAFITLILYHYPNQNPWFEGNFKLSKSL